MRVLRGSGGPRGRAVRDRAAARPGGARLDDDSLVRRARPRGSPRPRGTAQPAAHGRVRIAAADAGSAEPSHARAAVEAAQEQSDLVAGSSRKAFPPTG